MRSLRARLSLGVGLVIAVVLGVSGVLISNYAERTARDALDERLRRTAELSRATAVDAVQNALPDTDRRLDAVLGATGSSLRLFIDDVVVLEAGRPPLGRRRPAHRAAHRHEPRGALPRAGDAAGRRRPGRPGQARGRVVAGRARTAPGRARLAADVARDRRPARRRAGDLPGGGAHARAAAAAAVGRRADRGRGRPRRPRVRDRRAGRGAEPGRLVQRDAGAAERVRGAA